MVMVSAHRCGAGTDVELENTRTALNRALELDAEYVEFDVQRCADGTFVLFHDDALVVDGVERRLDGMTFEEFQLVADHFLRYDEVLAAIAESGKKAHIDFKFMSPEILFADPAATHEVAATQLALDVLGSDNMIVTTLEDPSVLAVRTWAEAEGIDLLVGLSLGRSREGLTRVNAARQVISELFPGRRYRAANANLVVVHRHFARALVARWARRHGLPMLVWTVDAEEELRYWLTPGRAWLVTTNHPDRALSIRRGRE